MKRARKKRRSAENKQPIVGKRPFFEVSVSRKIYTYVIAPFAIMCLLSIYPWIANRITTPRAEASTEFATSNKASSELTPDWSEAPWAPFKLIPHPQVKNPVLTANDVTDVPASMVADPFLFRDKGTWYLFFEVHNKVTRQGDIGLATSSDGLNWIYQRIVLSEPFHVSYPYVFKYNGNYYMIPETKDVWQVRLYRATHFPYKWVYSTTLVRGNHFNDPSIFRHDGTWYMFLGDGSNAEAYLYYSDNLHYGWQPHPMSPVVTKDRSKARPAGRVFSYNGGSLVRLAQKDDVFYGESVRAFEIDLLTKNSYLEHEISGGPILQKSGEGWNSAGMHTLDAQWTGRDWLCAVDGTSNPLKKSFSIGLYTAVR